MTITLQEAQVRLGELVHGLNPGEEVVIVENETAIAKLIATPPAEPLRERRFGTLKGTVLYMAPDFNAPLEDFKEYME